VKIETAQEQLIDFSHEVKFNEFALKPERGMTFIFENGEVFADMANNTLSITLNIDILHFLKKVDSYCGQLKVN
jgi:hypothetical protein